MKKVLTREQKRKLLLAIERARNPGHCVYREGGRPCCVIGQLAALEKVRGVDTWGSISVSSIQVKKLGKLTEYPDDLLRELQYAWDISDNVREGRERMRDIVRVWS